MNQRTLRKELTPKGYNSTECAKWVRWHPQAHRRPEKSRYVQAPHLSPNMQGLQTNSTLKRFTRASQYNIQVHGDERGEGLSSSQFRDHGKFLIPQGMYSAKRSQRKRNWLKANSTKRKHCWRVLDTKAFQAVFKLSRTCTGSRRARYTTSVNSDRLSGMW